MRHPVHSHRRTTSAPHRSHRCPRCLDRRRSAPRTVRIAAVPSCRHARCGQRTACTAGSQPATCSSLPPEGTEQVPEQGAEPRSVPCSVPKHPRTGLRPVLASSPTTRSDGLGSGAAGRWGGGRVRPVRGDAIRAVRSDAVRAVAARVGSCGAVQVARGPARWGGWCCWWCSGGVRGAGVATVRRVRPDLVHGARVSGADGGQAASSLAEVRPEVRPDQLPDAASGPTSCPKHPRTAGRPDAQRAPTTWSRGWGEWWCWAVGACRAVGAGRGRCGRGVPGRGPARRGAWCSGWCSGLRVVS